MLYDDRMVNALINEARTRNVSHETSDILKEIINYTLVVCIETSNSQIRANEGTREREEDAECEGKSCLVARLGSHKRREIYDPIVLNSVHNGKRPCYQEREVNEIKREDEKKRRMEGDRKWKKRKKEEKKEIAQKEI